MSPERPDRWPPPPDPPASTPAAGLFCGTLKRALVSQAENGRLLALACAPKVKPLTRQIVLALPFFLHVHNILDEHGFSMRELGPNDLDEIAASLASKIRENLIVIYNYPEVEERGR